MDHPVLIRPALPSDSAAYFAIEQAAYNPPLAESEQTFLAKLAAYPRGCKIAEINNQPIGYLLAHPWIFNAPPPLDCIPFTIPAQADSFFIHSLTLANKAKGRGAGRLLAQTALQLGLDAGFSQFALISVQDSKPFWEKIGFKTIEHPIPELSAKLASYGPSARYMTLSSKFPKR